MASLLAAFLPPDLSGAYLAALIPPVVETLGLTLGAMTVVVLLSAPLALAAALRLHGAAVVVNTLALLRSIPDLTLAILCVILFGIGPGAGLVALIIYYTAASTKMFADLIATTPRAPVEALRTTGAGRLAIACYGLLPLAAEDLFTYGAFAFECALRSAVIVGSVGGGGIGTELVGALAGFEFRRATTLILVLAIVVGALDRLALALRLHPLLLLAAVPVGLACCWIYGPELFAFRHALQVFAGMMPPRFGPDGLAGLPRLIVQTVVMAVVATLTAALVGLIFAAAAARTLAPRWLAFLIRRLLEFLRTIPEVVWGLLLVATAGVGPVAGTLALALHSLGSLGRLFADSLDTVPEGPRTALAGTGAPRVAIFAYAAMPAAWPAIATHLLFRLDWNLRMATVLGLIGAGGIGEALFQAQQLFFYDRVLAYLLVTAALIMVVDAATRRLRGWINAPRRGAARPPGSADPALAL